MMYIIYHINIKWFFLNISIYARARARTHTHTHTQHTHTRDANPTVQPPLDAA